MKTIYDANTESRPVMVHVNTSDGRINFYTDTGNKFEAVARLRKQEPSIKWADLHHAAVYL